MKITLMAAMMVAATAWAQPGDMGGAHKQQSAQYAKFSVYVMDFAQLGDATLRRAGTILGAIFRRAEVDIAVFLHSDGKPDREEPVGPRLSRIYVRILPPKKARRLEGQLRPGVMGVAPGSNVSRDCASVYLFSEAVLRWAALQTRGDRGTLLGYVMAHEIGHLLLHRTFHSEAGIMQAQWDEDDMRLMAQEGLSFCLQEAAEIRMEVARRHSIQAPTESMTVR